MVRTHLITARTICPLTRFHLNWSLVVEEAFVGVHQGAVPERCVEGVLNPEQFPLALRFPLLFVPTVTQ